MIWKQFTHLDNFPPELKSRFNSFLTTEFDDSLSVEMQFRSIIKWCQGNFKTVDTLIDFINDISNWLKEFENTFGTKLEERVISVLSEWQASGQLDVVVSEAIEWELDNYKTVTDNHLEDIDNTLVDINNTISEHKVDLEGLETRTTVIEGDIISNTTAIELANTNISNIEDKLYVSVTDFGAIGDGVTDDTQAIQTAINSCTNKPWVTVVFPPTDKSYLVSTLVIPEDTHTLRLQGIGRALIEFVSDIGFTIFSEYIVIDNLSLINKKSRETGSTINTRLFIDDRQYNRLDFDLKVTNCNIQGWQRVVQTWGRGVVLSDNEFNGITEFVIRLEVRPRHTIDEGTEPIHTYDEGYRGYEVTRNRFHYSPAIIMASAYDTEKVVQGINISDNRIEGTMHYYNGYAKNLIAKNNWQYHVNDTNRAMFEMSGGENIDISVDISTLGTSTIGSILTMTGSFKNVNVSGCVSGSDRNLIAISGSGSGLLVSVNVSDFTIGSYTPNLVTFAGSASVTGVVVAGVVESPDKALTGNTFAAIGNQGRGTVTRHNFKSLVIIGPYSYITNIPDD